MQKSTRNIIITTTFLAVMGLALHQFFKKKAKRVFHQSFKKIEDGNSIITIPDTSFNHPDILIIYGGLHYATPKWMYDQVFSVAPSLLYGNIVYPTWVTHVARMLKMVHNRSSPD